MLFVFHSDCGRLRENSRNGGHGFEILEGFSFLERMETNSVSASAYDIDGMCIFRCWVFRIFLNGLEPTIGLYILYPLSAYGLMTLVLFLWKVFPRIRKEAESNFVFRWIRNAGGDSVFDLSFYIEQVVNFCYGGLKLITGILLRSAWIGADGLYNFTQGVIQFIRSCAIGIQRICSVSGKFTVAAAA